MSASDFTIYLLLQYVGQYGLTFIQISKNYNLHVWALWNGSSALQLSSVNLWHFQKIEDQPINLNSNLWRFGPINSSTSWFFHHYASLISCMRRYELHVTLQILRLSTVVHSQHHNIHTLQHAETNGCDLPSNWGWAGGWWEMESTTWWTWELRSGCQRYR